MLNYLKSEVLTTEVPDEICLAYSITGCPIGCPDCHSKETWDKNNGTLLTVDGIIEEIKNKEHLTAILFYGGEWDEEYLTGLLVGIQHNYPMLTTVLYTGRSINYMVEEKRNLLNYLDYIKTEPFIKKYGPINNPKTNQEYYQIRRVYSLRGYIFLFKCTNKFWVKEI